ncbi:unnamed protein product, partial [Brassica oleracea var. botrytis]
YIIVLLVLSYLNHLPKIHNYRLYLQSFVQFLFFFLTTIFCSINFYVSLLINHVLGSKFQIF